MAYRQSERRQQMLFPPSIEEYILPDDPVRVYDAFVDSLDLEALGIHSTPQQAGLRPCSRGGGGVAPLRRPAGRLQGAGPWAKGHPPGPSVGRDRIEQPLPG